MANNDRIQPLDDNGKGLSSIDSYHVCKCSPGAFAGGTANSRGDYDGTGNPTTIFAVDGDVLLKVFSVCTTDLVGASATLSLGVAGNTAGLIALTTATDIDAGEIWNDTTPTVGVETYANILGAYVVVNGMDIIETAGTANITAGELYYVCMWRPLTSGSSVRAVY